MSKNFFGWRETRENAVLLGFCGFFGNVVCPKFKGFAENRFCFLLARVPKMEYSNYKFMATSGGIAYD
jgi:hypothetical protein